MKPILRGTLLILTVVVAMAACQKQNEGNGRYTRKNRGQDTPHGPGGGGATLNPDKPDGTFPGTQSGGTIPVPGTTAPGGNTSGQVNPPSASLGVVTPRSGSVTSDGKSYNANANDMTRWFTLTDLRPNEVGATTAEQDSSYNMPCLSTNSCGVTFSVGLDQSGKRMPLQFANNMTLSNVSNSQGYIPLVGGGNITIWIYDSLVGKTGPNGKPTDKIKFVIDIDQAAAYIQGNNFYLQFNDPYGSIVLRGTYTANMMNGNIEFYHVKIGKSGEDETPVNIRGTWGSFIANTCSVFRCQ